ncbi:hypothetical protein CFP66_41530 [Pseudonocardia sp. MH-G8]|nr:hypothetical protein CFP66_41530 [Pseudonocardia sp. MH-G8]
MRSTAQRGSLWAVLALLVALPTIACQIAAAPAAAHHGSAPALAASCHGQPGHDVFCDQGVATAAPQSSRAGRYDNLHNVLTPIAVTALIAASPTALRFAATFAQRTGPPSWAPRRLLTGRHHLVAIGISRI